MSVVGRARGGWRAVVTAVGVLVLPLTSTSSLALLASPATAAPSGSTAPATAPATTLTAPITIPAIAAPAPETDASGPVAPTPDCPRSTCNTAPQVAGPTGPSRDPDPDYRLTGGPAGLQCRVVRLPLVLRGWVPCSTDFSLALTPDDLDGRYVVQVRTPAGVVASGPEYDYDLTAPSPAILSGPSGALRRVPRWTWTGETGTTSRCSVFRAASLGQAASAEITDAPCTSGWSPRPTGDGVYRLQVVLVDAAGNASAAAMSPEVLVDTTAPAAPQVLLGADGNTQVWVAVAGRSEGTQQCRTVEPGLAPPAWQSCVLPRRQALPEGSRVDVRVVDAAGNVGATGTAARLPDAPLEPRISGPASPGAERDITFDVAPAQPGDRLDCRLIGDGVAGPWAPCTGAFTSSLPFDGAYTAEVRATSTTGVPGAVARASYVLDTRAPDPLAFRQEPARVGRATALRWRWQPETAVSYACSLVGPVGTVPLPGPCADGSQAADLSGAPDGLYRFAVVATDPAGNITRSELDSLLERTAPELTVTPPGTDSRTAPEWLLSTPARCSLFSIAGPVLGPVACDGVFAPSLQGQPDGVYTLQAEVTGPAGSAVQLSDYVLDTAAPRLVVSTGPSPGPSRRLIVTVATDDPTSSVECRVLGVVDWQPCPAAPVAVVPLDLTDRLDGTYVVQVRASSATGAASTVEVDYVLDTTAPDPVPVSAPAGRTSRFPRWGLGPHDAGTTLLCRLAGPDAGVEVPCEGDGFVAGPLDTDGTRLLTVVAVDAAGNRSAGATGAYDLDASAPAVGWPVPAQLPIGSGRAPSWTVLTEPGSVLTCSVTRDGSPVAAPGTCASPYVLDLTGGADGVYELTVRATDPTGQVSVAQTGSYLLDTQAPRGPVFTAQPGSPIGALSTAWVVDVGRDERLTCQLLRDGTALEPPRPCSTRQPLELGLIGRQGSYVLRTWSTDLAGNTGPAVDSDPCSYAASAGRGVVWVSAPSGHVRSDPPPWRFSGDPGVRFRCTLLRDGVVVDVRRDCGREYGTSELRRSGLYTLQVWVVDDGAAQTVPSERSFFLDLQDPEAPTLTGTLPALGREAAVSWSWRSTGEDAVQCRLLETGRAVPPWLDCSALGGVLRVVLPHDGAWSVQVRSLARSGRTSAPATSPTYLLDTTPPGPVRIHLDRTSATVGSVASVTWHVEVPPDATARCTVTASGQVLTHDRSCGPDYRLELAGRPAGEVRLVVELVDQAGNAARGESVFTLLPVPPRTPRTPALPQRPPAVLPVRGPLPVRGAAPAARGPVARPAPVPPATVLRPPNRTSSSVPALPWAAAPAPAAARAQVRVPGVPGPLDTAVRDVLTETLRRPALPLALALLVLGFLLVQNRLDRRDPKLASARASGEPDLDFGPVLGTDVERGVQ